MITRVEVILDRSGSMSALAEVTADKFNEYVNKLKSEQTKDSKFRLSLHQFDHEYETVYTDKKLKDVPELVAWSNYTPRGTTALLDAIGKTMSDDRVKLADGEKGICIVITDGYENSSKEYDNEAVAALIKKLEDEDAWTFVYLGANQDAFATAQKFGIRTADKTLSYGGNDIGTATSYTALLQSTVQYSRTPSAKGMANTNSFFTEKQQKEAERTKSGSSSK